LKDQDGISIFGDIIIDTGYEKHKFSGYSVVFTSPFNFDLDELKIIAKFGSEEKIITPNDYFIEIIFHREKLPNEKKEIYNQNQNNKKKIDQVEEHKKIIVEKIIDDTDEEGNEINLKKADVLDLNDNEPIDFNQILRDFDNQRNYDLFKDLYTDMARCDLQKVFKTIQATARILNNELKKKFKGIKTIEFTNEPRGPIAIKSTAINIARKIPKISYYDLISKQPPKNCYIFIDFSASTNNSIYYASFGWIQIKNSLIVTALSIGEVILELGGKVKIMIFSDSDNPHHCEVLEYYKGNQRKVLEKLLNLIPSGGTRLDEALEKILNKLNKNIPTINFILSDGAPQEGYFRVDVDDDIQSRTINYLKELEKSSSVFLLWSPCPNNKFDYDDFFFKRCSDELSNTIIVNVKSFALFPKKAHLIWNMPSESRKIISIYNTNSIFPFELSPDFKNEINHLKVENNIQETVRNVRKWIRENFKYSSPYGRKYRTAMEVVEARAGCCGEVSNLIVGMLRYFGIPSGILEVDYIEQVRINHAMVGFLDGQKPMCLDLTMGDINTKDAISNPVSDARWSRLMLYWRENLVALKNRK